MCERLSVQVPQLGLTLFDGCKIKLGRFDSEIWSLHHGWYSWGGNRPFCGWYLLSEDNHSIIKPLQMTDLDDIYLIQN